MSRQGILCPYRVLAKPRGFLIAKEHFYVATEFSHGGRIGVVTGFSLFAIETGQERRFYVATGHSLLRQRELLVRVIPCRDRVYYVTIRNGGSIRLCVGTEVVLTRGFFCRNIGF